MSPGDRVEIDANLNKVSEIEHGFQGSKDVGRNFNFQADGSIRRLLTAVPFTSSLRDTASHGVPLFVRVVAMREYSSHRVIRYTFLLARRIYIDPSV